MVACRPFRKSLVTYLLTVPLPVSWYCWRIVCYSILIVLVREKSEILECMDRRQGRKLAPCYTVRDWDLSKIQLYISWFWLDHFWRSHIFHSLINKRSWSDFFQFFICPKQLQFIYIFDKYFPRPILPVKYGILLVVLNKILPLVTCCTDVSLRKDTTVSSSKVLRVDGKRRIAKLN